MIRRFARPPAPPVAAAPPPQMSDPQPQFGFMDVTDGVRLRTAVWPAPVEALGTVLLLTGRGEFIEKYDEVAQDWLRRGYRPIAVDWRGQGGSSRLLADARKGHVRDFRDYTGDLEQVYTRLVRPAHAALEAERGGGELPMVLCAHSMGAHIALRWLAERVLPPAFTAGILVSPMTQLSMGGFLGRVAGFAVQTMMSRRLEQQYAPGQEPRPARFEGNALTQDRARWDRAEAWLQAVPSLRTGGATFGWLDAAFRSIARLRMDGMLERIETPLLIASSRDDRIVDADDHAEVARRVPLARLEHFHDSGHELLMEREGVRARLWHSIDGFLRGYGALPVPPPKPASFGGKPAAPRRAGMSHPLAARPL